MVGLHLDQKKREVDRDGASEAYAGCEQCGDSNPWSDPLLDLVQVSIFRSKESGTFGRIFWGCRKTIHGEAQA